MSDTDDNNELFLRLLTRHDPAIRAYVRASIPDPADVADVMQEVSVIAWKKFSTLEDPETGFGKWASVIARYEILKFRRGKARDRLVLDSDIIELLAEEGVDEAPEREQWIKTLKYCLEKLPQSRRELLMSAYHPEASIKELADTMNKQPNALYQILSRLRLSLADCIERETAQEPS
ncbi:sigma-70 family RNA polymerase sigma factor [Akkermansiaceae bacterium]|nr:sigma-70 family RNA polymerase sigma factor [Akkermansiaceae bacterium]